MLRNSLSRINPRTDLSILEKKKFGQLFILKFFTVDPYSEVIFSRDTHKVLKAHLGILRHGGGGSGSVGPKTIPYQPQSIVGEGPLYQKVLDLLGPHNNFFRTNPLF